MENQEDKQGKELPPPIGEKQSAGSQGAAATAGVAGPAEPPLNESMDKFLQDVAHVMAEGEKPPVDQNREQKTTLDPKVSSGFRIPSLPIRPRLQTQRLPSRLHFSQIPPPPPPASASNYYQETGRQSSGEAMSLRPTPREWPYGMPHGAARFPGRGFPRPQNQGYLGSHFQGFTDNRMLNRWPEENRQNVNSWERPTVPRGVNTSGPGNGGPPSPFVVPPGRGFPRFGQETPNKPSNIFEKDFVEKFTQDPQRFLSQDMVRRITKQATSRETHAQSNVESLAKAEESGAAAALHLGSPFGDASRKFGAGKSSAESATEDKYATRNTSIDNRPISTVRSEGKKAPLSTGFMDNQAGPSKRDMRSPTKGEALNLKRGAEPADATKPQTTGGASSTLSMEGYSNYVFNYPPPPPKKSRRTELRCRRIPEMKLEEVAKTLDNFSKDKNEPFGRLEDECLCNGCLEKIDDQISENIIMIMKRIHSRCPRCNLTERMKLYQKMCCVCSRIYNICFSCGKNSVISSRDTLNFHSLYINRSARILFASLSERRRRSIMQSTFRAWDTATQDQKLKAARDHLDSVLTHFRKTHNKP